MICKVDMVNKYIKIISILSLFCFVISTSGCLVADADDDGYPDKEDAFPNDARYHKDSDGDGYADEVDAFPTNKIFQQDSDSDGYADKIDEMPSNAFYHSKYDYYNEMILGTWFCEEQAHHDEKIADEGFAFCFNEDKTFSLFLYDELYQTHSGAYRWTIVEETVGTYEIARDNHDLIATFEDKSGVISIIEMDQKILVLTIDGEVIGFER